MSALILVLTVFVAYFGDLPPENIFRLLLVAAIVGIVEALAD